MLWTLADGVINIGWWCYEHWQFWFVNIQTDIVMNIDTDGIMNSDTDGVINIDIDPKWCQSIKLFGFDSIYGETCQ